MMSPKRVGVVGPTNALLMEEKAGLLPGTLENVAREVGAFLAEQSLAMVCIPVNGVPLWTLEAYKAAGGNDSNGESHHSFYEQHVRVISIDIYI